MKKTMRRARKKFDQLDVDGNGKLDGDELSELATAWLYSVDPPMHATTFAQAAELRQERSAAAAIWLRPSTRVSEMAAQAWTSMRINRPVLGLHVRGTDKRIGRSVEPASYFRFADAWLLHHPEGSLFLATDDREAIRAFRSRYDTRRLAFQRGVPRGTCDIRGSCEYSNPMSRARTSTDGVAPLGDSVLIDALLLGRCDFLVKSKSAVSEFAIYFSPRLHNASYDFELNGQPLPVDAWWTSRARTG